MAIQLPIVTFSAEQLELWNRVLDLWALSKRRDEGQIRSALHAQYVGWDMSAPLPHDRHAAVRSVSGDTPELQEYELHPLSVQVYDRQVGVVHYSYSAKVAQAQMGSSWRIGIDSRHPTELVQHGLFSISRNPIFLAIRVNFLGLFFVFPAGGTLALFVAAEILMQVQVRLEEQHLLSLHGESYAAYCSRVRRWL